MLEKGVLTGYSIFGYSVELKAIAVARAESSLKRRASAKRRVAHARKILIGRVARRWMGPSMMHRILAYASATALLSALESVSSLAFARTTSTGRAASERTETVTMQ